MAAMCVEPRLHACTPTIVRTQLPQTLFLTRIELCKAVSPETLSPVVGQLYIKLYCTPCYGPTWLAACDEVWPAAAAPHGCGLECCARAASDPLRTARPLSDARGCRQCGTSVLRHLRPLIYYYVIEKIKYGPWPLARDKRLQRPVPVLNTSCMSHDVSSDASSQGHP